MTLKKTHLAVATLLLMWILTDTQKLGNIPLVAMLLIFLIYGKNLRFAKLGNMEKALLEKVYPCYFPTNRSIKALIKNTKIAWDVLHKEKPDLIISCGAAVAVPFFYIGKMMGAKLVYIEVFDRIDKPTMTGKIVYPIVGQVCCAMGRAEKGLSESGQPRKYFLSRGKK